MLLVRQCLLACVLSLAFSGCGTTKSQMATEQMLVSDAVDRAVASIDFSVLAGQTVYLDSTYLKAIKTPVMVNENYIVSSLRQQLFAASCLVQDKAELAEFIIEARIGALGTDGHDVTYGVPPTGSLNTAASLVTSAPGLPILPELSVARRSTSSGAAKIAVFAYKRETREPFWQSGTAIALSSAKDTWFMGAGPFQSGTIYDSPTFAGSKLHLPLIPLSVGQEPDSRRAPFHRELSFAEDPSSLNPPRIGEAGYISEVVGDSDDAKNSKPKTLTPNKE